MPTLSLNPNDSPASVLSTQPPSVKALAVKFTATWCGPCKQHPFEKVAETSLGSLAFAVCDVDTCGRLAEQSLVRSIPTVLVFDRTGKVVGPPILGVVKADKLVELLRQRLALIP